MVTPKELKSRIKRVLDPNYMRLRERLALHAPRRQSMGILSDEPLIDDSSLDDFDWNAVPATQPVTPRGNMMKRYHQIMLSLTLVLSAGAFRLATRLLDSAKRHKEELQFLEFMHYHEALHDVFRFEAENKPARWDDAMHPDYVDHYSGK